MPFPAFLLNKKHRPSLSSVTNFKAMPVLFKPCITPKLTIQRSKVFYLSPSVAILKVYILFESIVKRQIDILFVAI
ncbi:MAG: hypothetical protein A2Z15_00710 [Chloroflexi bacterium RBG_16_50_11]|nr:MAG: hypothetical protein A2Z15_00710 [Chloroflexi bacterium RBG_16_50_11]